MDYTIDLPTTLAETQVTQVRAGLQEETETSEKGWGLGGWRGVWGVGGGCLAGGVVWGWGVVVSFLVGLFYLQ